MNSLSFLLLPLVFLLLSCNVNTVGVDTIDVSPDWNLVWNDEFDQDGLPDSTKWSYNVGDGCDWPQGCGWGNHELQFYTNKIEKNARVENGKLIIELHKEKINNSDYSSARLVTKGKGDWKYGRVEVKAIIPDGLGVWSAIWMLSSEDKYNGWPNSGEIDIMENVGYDPDTIVGTAHTKAYHHLIGTHKNGKIYHPSAQDSMTVYALEWEVDEYRLYVNDQKYFTYKNENTDFKAWPFDQNFYLILNLAFGGDWGGSKGIDSNILPVQMVIDYVRVYQKNNG